MVIMQYNTMQSLIARFLEFWPLFYKAMAGCWGNVERETQRDNV